jgi:hypothetical protein
VRHDRFYNFKEKNLMKKKRKLRTLQGMIFDDFLDLWLPFGSLWLPFGSLWLPFDSFGSLLAPLGFLLAPFGW